MQNKYSLKKLGEICSFQNGFAFKSSEYEDSGFFVMRIGNVQDGYISLSDPKYIQKSHKAFGKFILELGDILISLTGNVGRVGVINEEHLPAVINQRVARISLRNNDSVQKQFLLYFLQSSTFKEELIEAGHGAAQQNISTKDIENLQIPLPPLPEQLRIVSILDEALVKLEQARKNAETNLQNAKDIFESYLQNVFENPGEDWEEKKLGSVTLKIGSGATPRGGRESYKKEGISLIRSMNVHNRNFVERNLAFIDEKQASDLSNVTLEKGDVLLNITGASVARCCLFPERYLPARVNQHVSIIRPKQGIIDSAFLNYLFTSKVYRDKLLKIGEQGATRQAITKAQLENFIISIPRTLSEQLAIISNFNTLSTETKHLESIYQQKLACLDELRKSLLKKAFNGEL